MLDRRWSWPPVWWVQAQPTIWAMTIAHQLSKHTIVPLHHSHNPHVSLHEHGNPITNSTAHQNSPQPSTNQSTTTTTATHGHISKSKIHTSIHHKLTHTQQSPFNFITPSPTAGNPLLYTATPNTVLLPSYHLPLPAIPNTTPTTQTQLNRPKAACHLPPRPPQDLPSQP